MALIDGRPRVDKAALAKLKLTRRQMKGLKRWYSLPAWEQGRCCPFLGQAIPERCEICMKIFPSLPKMDAAKTFRRRCPCVFYKPKHVADVVKEYFINKGELIETGFDTYVTKRTYYWERFKYVYLPIGIVIAIIALIIFLTRCEQCC